jgi:hypothetical protein
LLANAISKASRHIGTQQRKNLEKAVVHVVGVRLFAQVDRLAAAARPTAACPKFNPNK